MFDCLFCKIAGKNIPASVVFENDAALAFLDIHPCAPGHAVVIPKRHAESVLDVPDEELGPVFQAVKEVTHRLTKALAPDGFTIGVNHKLHAGVDHFHIHVIPRWKNDGGGSIHTVVQNPGTESFEAVKERILGSF